MDQLLTSTTAYAVAFSKLVRFHAHTTPHLRLLRLPANAWLHSRAQQRLLSPLQQLTHLQGFALGTTTWLHKDELRGYWLADGSSRRSGGRGW